MVLGMVAAFAAAFAVAWTALTKPRKVEADEAQFIPAFNVLVEREPLRSAPKPAPGRRGPALRAIVISGGMRTESCVRLLASLERASNEGDRVDVDVWLEPQKDHAPGFLTAVRRMPWSHGAFRVMAWENHAGLRTQWIDTWAASLHASGQRLTPTTPEVAIILEDDLEVSPFYWRWLKAAHTFYAAEDRLAGFTLERARTCEAFCGDLEGGPTRFFGYRLVGTWGWSPKPAHMTRFRTWYHTLPSNYNPLVNTIIRSKWYSERVRAGQAERMWTMHHVKYADLHPDAYTLYVKLDGRQALVTNHEEPGLNYGGNKYNVTLLKCSRTDSVCPRDMVCSFDEGYCRHRLAKFAIADPKRHVHPSLMEWDDKYVSFPPPSRLYLLEWDAQPVPHSDYLPPGVSAEPKPRPELEGDAWKGRWPPPSDSPSPSSPTS